MTRYSVESATRALQENPNMPESGLKRHFEATISGTLPQFYREELQKLLTNYSDETPTVDVRSLIDDAKSLTKYKCQVNYCIYLCQTLQGAIEDEIVADPNVQKEISQFLGSDLNFQVGDLANQERIGRINKIIDSVLGTLGKDRV